MRKKALQNGSKDGTYENVAVLVALAVNEEGFREVIGVAEGMKETGRAGKAFCAALKSEVSKVLSFLSATDALALLMRSMKFILMPSTSAVRFIFAGMYFPLLHAPR